MRSVFNASDTEKDHGEERKLTTLAHFTVKVETIFAMRLRRNRNTSVLHNSGSILARCLAGYGDRNLAPDFLSRYPALRDFGRAGCRDDDFQKTVGIAGQGAATEKKSGIK